MSRSKDPRGIHSPSSAAATGAPFLNSRFASFNPPVKRPYAAIRRRLRRDWSQDIQGRVMGASIGEDLLVRVDSDAKTHQPGLTMKIEIFHHLVVEHGPGRELAPILRISRLFDLEHIPILVTDDECTRPALALE